MSILKTTELYHKYGSSWAIKDISIEIDRRGVFGLLGSNGAGKSTLMNIICGTLNPTRGDVYLNDVNLKEEPELAKRNIGFLPQLLPLYLDFTVDEFLSYAAHLRLIESANIRKAVEEAKEKCQISHFSDRLIGNLSGGYRQRVGIAQAIIHKPQLIVLDEPTTGLDPNQLIEARKLIKELGKEYTILLSSHIMSEISLLCHEIIMIEGGNIIFSDSIDAFHNHIDSKTIRVVFGNPPSREELIEIKNVTNAEAKASGEFKVYFNNDNNITDKIIRLSLEKGWNLKEISFEKQLLDDVFRHLSSQSTN